MNEKKSWLSHFTKTTLYKSLNDDQKRAVELPYNENGLIIAGAGTGKTKTLITRICALVQAKVYQPQDIVALTFTNKAANEMKVRLKDSLKEKANDINIGTFHSFALKLIKDNLELFNIHKNFKILDEKEQFNIVKTLFQENNWKAKKDAINTFIDFVNHQKENGVRANKVHLKGRGSRTLINQYKVYEQYVKENNLLDFTEMLLRVKEQIESNEQYYQKIINTYKVFLVDEFQDTNPLQYDFLKLVTKEKGSIFGVGDDCQSIYSFRGAEVKNIIDFKDFVKDNYVKLEQNYRSSQHIVNASNDLIEKSKEKIEKNLWTINEEGKLIYINRCKSEYEEAKFVCEQIELITKDKKVKYKDFSIIYRNNAQSAKIETQLSLRKIPYKVSGGMSFFDKSEIKTLLSCAKILINLNEANDFMRVVDKLGVIPVKKEIIERWMVEASMEKIDFFSLLERKAYTYDEINKLIETIILAQESFSFNSLKESFEKYLDKIGFFNLKELDDETRKENVNFFLNQIDLYEKNGGKSFVDFIAHIDLSRNLNIDYKNDDVVILQTIHASKGLEYDFVFIVGVEDNLIPSTHSIDNDNVEEERRLMYVAMTRAKKELFITYCESRFNGFEKVKYLPSRFLCDIDERFFTNISGHNFQIFSLKGTEEFDKIVAEENLEEEKAIYQKQNEENLNFLLNFT